MTTDSNYLFTSSRLGFRRWKASDTTELYAMNNDPEVMKFFPGTQNLEETSAFVTRMNDQYKQNGFCYYAVDVLETNNFIGFIGLAEQNYPAPFTPCVDIGWRIKSSEWNKGYATEGAQRCLDYAFQSLGLSDIYAVAPKINERSLHLMKKIGMNKWGEFEHPKLKETKPLSTCVVYKISAPSAI